MCGRYLINRTAPVIKQLLTRLEEQGFSVKTGEIFPSNEVPVMILGENEEVDAADMTWGFHGFRKGQLIINARSETVMEKKMFAKAFRETRCVFPTSGFYEWDEQKEKFLLKEDDVVYLAGFYKKFEDGLRCVILTTAANESVAPIHDRMPVVLNQEELLPWLKDLQFAEEILAKEMPELTSVKVEK